MKPTDIPATVTAQDGELIAFASTEAAGLVANLIGRTRWTEIAVWYLHKPTMGGKRWHARVSGYSRVEGEGARHTGITSGTLERALKIVDQNGDIGIAVAETAREWAEDNRVTVENGRGRPLQFDTDTAALTWLYGAPDDGHTGFATMLARDTGAGASTVRMQIAAGRPVMVPLRAILPFIDRAAFRRARASRGVETDHMSEAEFAAFAEKREKARG